MFRSGWLVAAVLLGGASFVALQFGSPSTGAARAAQPRDGQPTGEEKVHAAQAAADEPKAAAEAKGLALDAEARERLGLRLEAVEAAVLQPELRVIGAIEADSARTFVVRAPVAGYVRAAGTAWPDVGAEVAAQAVVGAVQPRLTPLEQFALAGQYLDAQSSVAEAEAELDAARSSYESKKSLNADGKMVSDRQLDEAQSRLLVVEARLSAARRKLALLDEQRGTAERGLPPLEVRAGLAGQVVEVLAVPGESVESGQALLKITGFDQLIARVELPLGETWTPGQAAARVAVVGSEATVFEARAAGAAPRAAGRTRGEAWLLTLTLGGGRAAPPQSELRPGTPVVAFLPVAGAPLRGVYVPDSAIIRYGGLAWVFAAQQDGTLARMPVGLRAPTTRGWFVTEGLRGGESVVVAGAQMLLSEQLKTEIEAEAEASE